jgi:hypothetical protein
MGTRATYRIKEASNDCGFNRSQSKYFYIHWDGYPEGAADYFKQMQNNLETLKVKHSFHKEEEFELKFGKAIIAFGMIGPAEFTEDHEEHGDTEFQYNLFYSHKTDSWDVEVVEVKRWNEDRVVRESVIFDGTLNDFFDKFYNKKGVL